MLEKGMSLDEIAEKLNEKGVRLRMAGAGGRPPPFGKRSSHNSKGAHSPDSPLDLAFAKREEQEPLISSPRGSRGRPRTGDQGCAAASGPR
jgi:hypothetical protein